MRILDMDGNAELTKEEVIKRIEMAAAFILPFSKLLDIAFETGADFGAEEAAGCAAARSGTHHTFGRNADWSSREG
jgi:hypothetical protein